MEVPLCTAEGSILKTSVSSERYLGADLLWLAFRYKQQTINPHQVDGRRGSRSASALLAPSDDVVIHNQYKRRPVSYRPNFCHPLFVYYPWGDVLKWHPLEWLHMPNVDRIDPMVDRMRFVLSNFDPRWCRDGDLFSALTTCVHIN